MAQLLLLFRYTWQRRHSSLPVLIFKATAPKVFSDLRRLFRKQVRILKKRTTTWHILLLRSLQKVVDAGESKLHMATRDVLIRAFMAGAILALAAVFAITIAVQTGVPLIGALLFPVGFCMLYLLGYDLLTGVFVLTPLAWLDKRPGVTWARILKTGAGIFR